MLQKMIDIHITTCHHNSVKCRPRKEGNTKEWTPEERLNISKYSVDSISRFVSVLPKNKISRFTIIDDGSDYLPAIKWLESLTWPKVIHYPHRGSSAGINDYMTKLNADMVVHFEDDHIMFNPLSLRWDNICFDALAASQVDVVTFKSSLPSEQRDPGLHGAWGPIGWLSEIQAIAYKSMGNAHHVMMADTYRKYLPLEGSSGGCETFMNQRLRSSKKINIELQFALYAFHSHLWSFPLQNKVTTRELSRSGEGWEYGIKDMHEYLLAGNPIACEWWENYAIKQKKTLNFTEYNY